MTLFAPLIAKAPGISISVQTAPFSVQTAPRWQQGLRTRAPAPAACSALFKLPSLLEFLAGLCVCVRLQMQRRSHRWRRRNVCTVRGGEVQGKPGLWPVRSLSGELSLGCWQQSLDKLQVRPGPLRTGRRPVHRVLCERLRVRARQLELPGVPGPLGIARWKQCPDSKSTVQVRTIAVLKNPIIEGLLSDSCQYGSR